MQGGYDSKLIPIVSGSSNCLRHNDRDTGVAIFNRSGTQAVSEGTQISERELEQHSHLFTQIKAVYSAGRQ